MDHRPLLARRPASRAAALLVLGCAAAALLATGCQPGRALRRALAPASPHEQYLRSLETAGLGDSALAREWRASSRAVLAAPTPVALPFAEAVYVDPARPRALGYHVTLRRGQRLEIDVAQDAADPGRVFVDIFEADEPLDGDVRPVASAPDAQATVSLEASQDGAYVIRVQPELLRGGVLRVTSRAAAALLFPVPSVTGAALQSVFGDARDAGRRRHEGVDIFAPRGAPVVSASDGVVTSVGENRLGGRVVWVWDPRRNVTLYYAHLQDQHARAGTTILAGDPIGTVGNTGNARSTAPHLHFGIYAGGEGALDPDGFVRPVPEVAADIGSPPGQPGSWARVARGAAQVRRAPAADAGSLARLPPGTTALVTGLTSRWARVDLPDGVRGFLLRRELDLAARPLRTVKVAAGTSVLAEPGPGAPVRLVLDAPRQLAILGTFAGHALVTLDEDAVGWLPSPL